MNKHDIDKEAMRLLKELGRYDDCCLTDKPYFMLGFISNASFRNTREMMQAIVEKIKENNKVIQ